MSANFEVIRLAVNQADLKMSINVYRLIKKLALKEEYYVIFAERMIQHPAVKNVCDTDLSVLLG